MKTMVNTESRGTIKNKHYKFMVFAQEEATESLSNGGIPVGLFS